MVQVALQDELSVASAFGTLTHLMGLFNFNQIVKIKQYDEFQIKSTAAFGVSLTRCEKSSALMSQICLCHSFKSRGRLLLKALLVQDNTILPTFRVLAE